MESVDKSFWDKKIVKCILAIGTILSAVVGVVSICLYLYKKAPQLEVEILSENSLFSVDETVPQMQIMIDSIDLQEKNKNITIYSLRIVNCGSKNISLYDFDTGDVEIRIKGGSIIETPSIIDYSSDYIVHKVDTALFRSSNTSIIIPHAIYNIDDYYTLHFFIMHDKAQSPSFECFGQIVGQKKINVVKYNKTNQSIWQKTIQGSIYIQIYRLFVYGLLLLIITAIATALYYWLLLFFKYIKKCIFLFIYRHKNRNNYIVYSDYRQNGLININRAHSVIKLESDRLTELYNKAQSYIKSSKENEGNRMWTIYKERISIYNELARLGYLIITKESVEFNNQFKDAVITIHDYFENIDRRRSGLGYNYWEAEVMLRDCEDNMDA